MTDAWTITHANDPEWNDATGTYTDVAPSTIYSGKGKLQSFESYEQKPEAGAHQYVEMRPSLHLPVSTSGDVKVGDIATRTACPTNAAGVGTVVTIAGAPSGDKSHATANRFPVSELVA